MFDYQLEIDQDKCTGCGLCAEVCPVLALDFDPGKNIAFVNDKDACLICKQCLDVCPVGAVMMQGGYWQTDIRTS